MGGGWNLHEIGKNEEEIWIIKRKKMHYFFFGTHFGWVNQNICFVSETSGHI